MKEEIDSKIRLYPSDWRYSASIVGLCLFFDYSEIDYIKTDDYIEYEKFEFDEFYKNKYLIFAEHYFYNYMHHKVIEDLLEKDSLTENDEKKLNEKFVANSIMKTIFKDTKKYSAENILDIKNLIDENKLELIEKTYATGLSLYAKFINSGKIFSEKGKLCRLNGYYEDAGRKSKSLSYNWNTATFNYEDELEFDFIPFAFTKTRESFFINNNITIDELIKSNKNLHNEITENMSPRQLLFQYKHTTSNIKYSVEILTKDINNDYYETIFVRESAIKIFEKIEEPTYDILTKPCRYNDGYLDIQKIVTNNILNNIHLDGLIEKLFKSEQNSYLQRNLIIINNLIYGGENMDEKIKIARNTAFNVKKNLESNKLNSYKQKLISAITFNDYDKFCKILLQLSDYSGVIFTFAYDLFDDFDSNKNIAYAFINGLNGDYKPNNNENQDGSDN